MNFSKLLLSSAALAAVFTACGPVTVEPELTLSPSPRALDGLGQTSSVKVRAVDDKGKAGTGNVRVTSTAGSLKAGVDVQLSGGEGSVDFACERATDPTCTGSVRLSAEWLVSGKLVTASASINIAAPVVDAGVDAGIDAGVIDAGVDAGMPVDAGVIVVLAADKTQIIAGVGDPSVLSATVTSVGQPVANEPVVFSATVGRLGPVAGSGVGLTYMATTNAQGVAQAQLVAGSMDMGQSIVRASVDGGVSNAITVNIVNVSQIGYVSTECPQTLTNCNLMGLQGSGFNETALVKFKVTDGAGSGVSGVRVDFALVNAPAGTSVDPTGMTNAMGEVRANVRAGTTVGTFSVTAVALTTFTVTSPTIGVRGAKASNRGFTLRCDKTNLPAYAAVTPPLPLTVTCTVGLTDRYGNPVGTGTQVRLNSEAGTVPNNVATNPFMPGNMTEGLGTFTFSTLGNFPAVDVSPLPLDAAQYPYPRFLEPSSVVGPLTRNPRDGLVSIIAYLQGEEDFKDDNSNGIRDSTEQFVDQGEPFVDSNDNNQWDVGEFFIDTPPSDGGVPNGTWDPPNGAWDSNAQIWTEYRLLYSGVTDGSLANLTLSNTRTGSSSYGTLGLGQTAVLKAFMPDQNLNRVEGGSTFTARFVPATRGSLTVTTNAGLDGYGFGFERRLVNATGTGPCSPTELVCRWRVLFGTWSEGYVADIQLLGGTAPTMPTAQNVIGEMTVRGVTATATSPGIVE